MNTVTVSPARSQLGMSRLSRPVVVGALASLDGDVLEIPPTPPKSRPRSNPPKTPYWIEDENSNITNEKIMYRPQSNPLQESLNLNVGSLYQFFSESKISHNVPFGSRVLNTYHEHFSEDGSVISDGGSLDIPPPCKPKKKKARRKKKVPLPMDVPKRVSNCKTVSKGGNRRVGGTVKKNTVSHLLYRSAVKGKSDQEMECRLGCPVCHRESE